MTTHTVTDPPLSERPTMPWRPQESLRPTIPVPGAEDAVLLEGAVPAHIDALPARAPANDVERPSRFGLWIAVCGAVLFGVVVAALVAPALVEGLGPEGARELAAIPGSASPGAVVEATPSHAASRPAASGLTAARAADRAAAPTNRPARHEAAPPPAVAAAHVQAPAEADPAAPEVSEPAERAPEARPEAPRRAAFGLARRSAAREVAEARVRERRVGRSEAPPPETSDAPLTADAVRPVVARGQRRFRQCYERAVRHAGAAVDARVTVTMDIAPSGAVTNVDVDGPDFGGMAGCLRNSARRFQFPPSAAGGQVPVPLSFTAMR